MLQVCQDSYGKDFSMIYNEAKLLKWKVESDEFYIKPGLKGRSYHEEIIKKLGREPRRRALKPWIERGTLRISR